MDIPLTVKLKRAVKLVLYSSVAHLSLFTGITAVRGRRSHYGSFRVLMYHKISPEFRPELSVRTELFRRQQELLANNFNVISLDELEGTLERGIALPPRAVLLTFDDGYRNNLTEAYPVLKEFGHKAVIFIPTDYVGGGTLPHDRRMLHPDPVLEWNELKSMLDVFEAGSQGCSHRILSVLDIHDVEREVLLSKQFLEASLGRPVRAFAYPSGSVGDFNSAAEEMVARSGYKFCFTSIPGANVLPMHPLRLGRYGVEDFGLAYFRRLLDGSADLVGIKDTRVGYMVKSVINKILGLETPDSIPIARPNLLDGVNANQAQESRLNKSSAIFETRI